jgi:hypothetical protein
MVLANVNRKRHPPHFWWKELKQYTHWDLMETNVWHTTSEIKDTKFLLHYKMNFEAFNNLVLELTSFLQSSCLNLVRPQLKIKKIMAIVIYRFVHGFSATHMADQFNVGASIIRKYVDIVYDVLIDKDKLFNKYISILLGQYLKDIITRFENLIGIPNICGVIDGTHIPLADFPSKKITLAIGDFLIGKSSIVLCCKS